MNHAAAARRVRAIVTAIKAGKTPSQMAAEHGLTERYILMIAQRAGIARPAGRPIGSTRAIMPRKAPAQRGGYSMNQVEDHAC